VKNIFQEIEALQRKGWMFVIWITFGGNVIIQGKFGKYEEDWDFDVSCSSLQEALEQIMKLARLQSSGGLLDEQVQ
jgi:hypothetical protein